MMNNIYFLSGLPRTGSTLLTSIISQNPKIHTDSNSPLCQLMWDMEMSINNTEQMINRHDIKEKMISSIPKILYQGVENNIIDKCRTWTLPDNLDLINKYITDNPKIVVMLRPLVDILKSFIYIRTLNGWNNPEYDLLTENSDPIMRSLDAVKYAKSINSNQFLFIQYDDLVDNPTETINKIYEFYEWESFTHNFYDIKNKNIEIDGTLRMFGLHDIRSTIGRRNIDIELSDDLLHRVNTLESLGVL